MRIGRVKNRDADQVLTLNGAKYRRSHLRESHPDRNANSAEDGHLYLFEELPGQRAA